MKKTNQKTLEEIIRVDHAVERGTIKIYEGQLLTLKTIKQDDDLKEKIVFIEASEIPKILKLTSLQLIVLFFNCSKICSFVRVLVIPSSLHTSDSVKKPCSMPK